MNRADRNVSIESIRGRFEKMVSAVFVNFSGMTVEEVTKLRDEFRKSGVEYRVVKNSLVRQALRSAPYADRLGTALRGMTGVAWSYEDPAAAAKVIKAFAKDKPNLKVKAGVIESQVLDAKAVEDQLSTMPGKDELRAMLLATLLAPAQNLVAMLNAPAQNAALVLDARRRQLEEA